MSKSAVRNVVSDSLFDRDELVFLHREFHDGCMKVLFNLFIIISAAQFSSVTT